MLQQRRGQQDRRKEAQKTLRLLYVGPALAFLFLVVIVVWHGAIDDDDDDTPILTKSSSLVSSSIGDVPNKTIARAPVFLSGADDNDPIVGLAARLRLDRQMREEQDEFCRKFQAEKAAGTSDNENTQVVKLPSLVSRRGGNFLMHIYKTDDIVSRVVRNRKGWETDKMIPITRWLKAYSEGNKVPLSNVTFVDVGANIGYYTLAAAEMGVKVIAVEPMPSNQKLLRRSLCDNPELAKRVVLHPVGLSKVPNQRCLLYSDDRNVGDGHMACGPESEIKIPRGYHIRATVNLRLIDEIVAPTPDQHIAVIKMDTEGSEANVVAGGPRLFGSGLVPNILTEYHPKWIQEKGGNPQEMVDTLYRAGYQARNIKSKDFLSHEQTHDETLMKTGYYLFSKK